jgi:hypothetical protein
MLIVSNNLLTDWEIVGKKSAIPKKKFFPKKRRTGIDGNKSRRTNKMHLGCGHKRAFSSHSTAPVSIQATIHQMNNL